MSGQSFNEASDICEYTILKEWGHVQPKPPLTDQVSRATSVHHEGCDNTHSPREPDDILTLFLRKTFFVEFHLI